MRRAAAALAMTALAGIAVAADLDPAVPRHTLRGLVTVENGEPALRACGRDGRRYALVDAAGGEVLRTYADLAAGPGAPVFMELRGAVLEGPAGAAGTAPPRILHAEALERAEREGPGCRAALGRIDARAAGTDPAWQAEFTRAGVTFASLRQPGMLMFAAHTAAWQPGEPLRYSGTSDGSALELVLTPERCRDAKTGNVYSLSAIARLNGEEYRGCAYRGRAAAPMR